MYSGTLLIFCWTFVVVKSFPALVEDYYMYSRPDNVEEIKYLEEYQSPVHHHSASPCWRNQKDEVKCFFNAARNGQLPGNLGYTSLADEPTGTAEFSRQLELDRDIIYDQSHRDSENAVVEFMPSFNPNYNVYRHDGQDRIGTYIHGLVPSQGNSVFDSDVYIPENRLPFNRVARKTSSYDDFLAQLSHDAMMNNILPTMPYLRTTGAQYLVPYDNRLSPAQASFPIAGTKGCAQPILFGCTPTISQGYVAHRRYPYVAAKVLRQYKGYTVPANQLTRDKVKSSDKIKQDFPKVLTESIPFVNA